MNFSTSKMKCYKGCKMLYFFKYVEGLTCLDEKAEALIDGTTYHEMIENLYNTKELKLDIENSPKISAMATAYKEYIYPQFEVKNAEESFEVEIAKGITLNGRYDAIADGGYIVEHKTTSSEVDERYIHRLNWDEQILNYMLASGSRQIIYTVCRKPTLRQGRLESNEDYYNRCVEWYKEDTCKKINLVIITRTDEEVENHKKHLIAVAKEMEQKEEEIKTGTPEEVFYRNPGYCSQYGRECEFAQICLDYKPTNVYVNFKKKEEL